MRNTEKKQIMQAENTDLTFTFCLQLFDCNFLNNFKNNLKN